MTDLFIIHFEHTLKSDENSLENRDVSMECLIHKFYCKRLSFFENYER